MMIDAASAPDQFDGRIEDGIEEDRLDVRVAVIAVDVLEALEVQRFAAEDLNGRHTRQVLLQIRVDARDERADHSIRLADVAAEPLGDQDDQRQDDEARQRQLRVHAQHHDHDAEQREHIAEDGDDSGGEQVVQDIHVARDARHQAANGITVVEPQIQPLQMGVNLHPQVVHDALPGQLHHPRLDVLERERGEQHGQKLPGDHRQAAEILVRNVVVDRNPRKVRRRELEHRAGDDRHQRDGDLRLVGTQIAQQPLHQAAVVGFADYIFIVNRHFHRRT